MNQARQGGSNPRYERPRPGRLIDDVALALADGMSRRDALRLIGAGIVGISLASSIRPRGARAADVCGSRVPYYPGCELPVAAESPRGSLGIASLGCSPWGLLPSFQPIPFDLDCQSLATCYSDCGESQANCDARFYTRMIQTCNAGAAATPTAQLAQIVCLTSAYTNSALIQSQPEGSLGNFNKIRADLCDCCDCPGGCPDGSACCGGDCIDVSSDPSNCGACGQVCSGDWPGGYACCNGTCTELGTTDNCTGCGDQCTCPPDGGSPACYDDACNCF